MVLSVAMVGSALPEGFGSGLFGNLFHTAQAADDTEAFEELGGRVQGYSLCLDGDIGVNFYMELSDAVKNSDSAYVSFSVPQGDKKVVQTVMVKDVLDQMKVIAGKDCYPFKCTVSAKDINSTITAQLIDGDSAGEIYEYSVVDYASYILDNPSEYEAEIPLVKALLNYGAYAQGYFGVWGNGPANEILSENDRNVSFVTADTIKAEVNFRNLYNLPEGVTFYGATLSLKSETTLSLYFVTEKEIKVYCQNKQIEMETVGGYTVARVRNINAKELFNTSDIDGGLVGGASLVAEEFSKIVNYDK